MSSELSQKERILKAIQVIKQSEATILEAEKVEAVLYAMATKFLNVTDMNDVKEEIKMTLLGSLIYNDGINDGILKGSVENARNFLINGASFDLVRKSIHNISDEDLQKIYDEVMADKTT